jgi:hypothetical protein
VTIANAQSVIVCVKAPSDYRDAKGSGQVAITSIQDVTGGAPLVFTDSLGAQRSVPLSAFQFNGSTVEVVSAWKSQFTAADLVIVNALTAAKAAGGEFTPPPVVPPAPAVLFTATTAGPEGNGISLTLAPDNGGLLDAKLTITAKEVDTYSGLAGATAAAAAIGVDVAGPPPGPAAGSIGPAGLPKDGQTLSVKAATAVLATDGTTTLFKLVARSGYTGTGIPVTVKLDAGGTTFTVQATYDAGVNPPVTVTGLGALPGPIAFLVTAKAPPSGYALPVSSTIALSGGAPGIQATGTVYTS